MFCASTSSPTPKLSCPWQAAIDQIGFIELVEAEQAEDSCYFVSGHYVDHVGTNVSMAI